VKTNKVKQARELRKHSSDKKNIMRHSGYDRKASYVRSKVLRILINLFRFRSRNTAITSKKRRSIWETWTVSSKEEPSRNRRWADWSERNVLSTRFNCNFLHFSSWAMTLESEKRWNITASGGKKSSRRRTGDARWVEWKWRKTREEIADEKPLLFEDSFELCQIWIKDHF
jgi:hypothetical protein